MVLFDPAGLLDASPDEAPAVAISPFYDLYRYYIKLVVNFNVYYFGILGILLSFLATYKAVDSKIMQSLLVVPLVLSFCQTIVYQRSLSLATDLHDVKLTYLRATIKDKDKDKDKDFNQNNINPLWDILQCFTVIHLLLFIGLLYAIIELTQ
jgi:hypothetical protein